MMEASNSNSGVENRKVSIVRRRLFVKHDRESSGSSVTSQEKRSSGVFSFFRWFKKSDEQINGGEGKNSSLPASPNLKRNQSLSCGSLLSTATVSSFSFVNPGVYRPHVSLRQIHPGPDTDTYRNRIKQRDQLRETEKDLTLKKKYKLLGSSTTSIYRSVETLPTCERPAGVMRSASLGRKKRKAPQPPQGEVSLLEVKTQRGLYGHRRTVSDCEARRVHVKGKRKAPPPPTPTSSMNNTLSRSWRKKRPAPSLPFNSEEKTRLLHSLEKLKAHAEKQNSLNSSPLLGAGDTVSNDFLKLESGVLKSKEEVTGRAKDRSVTPSSPVSPRQWYKRNRQPSYSEKLKGKDKENDWLSEGNVQPRNNSVSESDKIQALIRQSLLVTNELKPSTSKSIAIISENNDKASTINDKTSASNSKASTTDNHKRSHSFFSEGLKHSLSSSSCNSNTSTSQPSHSRFSFFSRSSDDSKRRSQVSMLANISALDREAAEIIEREHQRQKALRELENAKFYSDIEIPDLSPEHEYTEIIEQDQPEVETKRASTRELISLFNAIGNVTRVTVNTTFFNRDTASNLFSRSDKKFNVNCKPSPSNGRKEVFKKIDNFDELQEWTESPRARRANQAEQRAKLRLGFGEPYRPSETDSEEGVTIEEIEDERVEKPESTRVAYKFHRSPSPSIPTILELSEHSSATTPASTLNPASELSSLASTPLSPQAPSAPTLSNPRSTPHIDQLVWACPQCTLDNLKWKFVCDACNFFRPFTIEMKPKTTLGLEHLPAASKTNERADDTGGILGTNASSSGAANETSAPTSSSEPGFCTRPSSSAAASRKAPYYMSDVLKSPDKQLSIIDRIKALPSTSILDPEPQASPKETAKKIMLKEQEKVEVKQESSKEMEELRKARLAFFDKTNREVNGKPEAQGSNQPKEQTEGRVNGETKPCDTSDLRKLLREMKHSIPQSSNALVNNYAASTSGDDHEIKPFVKFENSKVLQRMKSTETSTSSSVSEHQKNSRSVCVAESVGLAESSKNVGVVVARSKDKGESSKVTNSSAPTNVKPILVVEGKTSSDKTEEVTKVTPVNGTKVIATKMKANESSQSETKVMTNINGPKCNEKLVNITNLKRPIITESVTQAKQNGPNVNGNMNGPSVNGPNLTNGIINSGPEHGAVKKTNNCLGFDDVEFDDNSLDRIKQEDEKKAEVYLIKSKTILEDILVKKPTSKVSISVQTNSSIVRKTEIVSTNPNRDAANVTVPVIEEHYKINPDGTLVTSLSKRNKIIGTGTFQLIRSRDFVGIEASKTGAGVFQQDSRHTYANVDDDSQSTSVSTCTSSTNCTSQVSPLPQDERTSNLIRSKCFADFKARFVSTNNNVNTVAVNRLLKRLEAAIANGEHHKAASLAKELARLKISCSVTRQNSVDENKSKNILVNMYVEDKVSHQGPIPLSVLSSMTVGQLKQKLEIEYEIPAKVQRWILGKSLGTNENATLEQMGVSENGTPVFLYLVAPEPPRLGASTGAIPSPMGIPGPSHVPLSPDTQTASTSFGTLNSAESSRASSLERDLSEHQHHTAHSVEEDYIVEEAEESTASSSFDFVPMKTGPTSSRFTELPNNPTRSSQPTSSQFTDFPIDNHRPSLNKQPSQNTPIQNTPQPSPTTFTPCPTRPFQNTPSKTSSPGNKLASPPVSTISSTVPPSPPTSSQFTPISSKPSVSHASNDCSPSNMTSTINVSQISASSPSKFTPISSPSGAPPISASTSSSSTASNITLVPNSAPTSSTSTVSNMTLVLNTPHMIPSSSKVTSSPSSSKATPTSPITPVSPSSKATPTPSFSPPSSPDLPTLPLSSTLRVGWRCPLCTLMNSPTRPGCAVCDTERPLGYRVPQHYAMSPTEMSRLRNEEQIEKDVAAQKESNYNELVLLERAELVLNADNFECPICFLDCPPNNGAVLRECLHSFCKPCLSATIHYNSEVSVKCPYRDTSYACDSVIQEREIKALVSPVAYEQHLAKSVAHAEAQIQNAFHCKTPDCRGWCIFEDNVNEFRCPVCTHLNCLTCQAIHDGLNCKQYQDHMKADSESNQDARRTRDMLDEMVERGEAMVCPQCHVVLMKKWGCDWLRCSMCKTEICWVTRGPRWGPNGKGDTSAGCKCGIKSHF
uniref:RanBP-type and C3HC4-type zinc finger-containing protein 1 n=1 Tax=Cacopsylla melanoneura TaxID=428564 RepID=A0A8D9ETE8_9HEMI